MEIIDYDKIERKIINDEVKIEDKIKSPSHYKLDGLGIESIDILRQDLVKMVSKPFV